MMTTSLSTLTSDVRRTAGICQELAKASCLDPLQLIQLEWSFRQWVRITSRYETRLARQRILIIFLLIRYTGATLEEVLALNLETDFVEQSLLIRDGETRQQVIRRVPLVGHIAQDIREFLRNPDIYSACTDQSALQPSAVRHKFHQRAEACGFLESLGSPEKIRLARATELLRKGVSPSEIVQLMGCSFFARNPPHNPAKDLADTSPLRKNLFATNRKRNTFCGEIVEVQGGTLQSQILLCTSTGHHFIVIVSNDSTDRLALRPGSRVTAEIKPHAVNLQINNPYATSSIDNCFAGEIVGITRGKVSWECAVDIGGGVNIYSLISVHYAVTLNLRIGRKAWVAFNSFAVILHLP